MTVQETWDLACKVMCIDKPGGLTTEAYNEMFSGMKKEAIFEMASAAVKEIIDKYEDKRRIKIGDIVQNRDGIKRLVLDEDSYNGNFVFYTFSENGCVERMRPKLLTKVKSTNAVNVMLKELRK